MGKLKIEFESRWAEICNPPGVLVPYVLIKSIQTSRADRLAPGGTLGAAGAVGSVRDPEEVLFALAHAAEKSKSDIEVEGDEASIVLSIFGWQPLADGNGSLTCRMCGRCRDREGQANASCCAVRDHRLALCGRCQAGPPRGNANGDSAPARGLDCKLPPVEVRPTHVSRARKGEGASRAGAPAPAAAGTDSSSAGCAAFGATAAGAARAGPAPPT